MSRRQRDLDGPVRGFLYAAPLIVALWLVIVAAVLLACGRAAS